MKKIALSLLMSVLALPALAGETSDNNGSSEVAYTCYEEGLKAVVNYLETTQEEFLKDNGPIFICISKEEPTQEVYQWGNGSGLVGIEYVVKDGKCVVSEPPYSGQDDGDLDLEWAQNNCKNW